MKLCFTLIAIITVASIGELYAREMRTPLPLYKGSIHYPTQVHRHQ